LRAVVVGLGYVGVPLAATLASKGHEVTGLDIDAHRVELVNKGFMPLEGDEPGLEALLEKGAARGRLTATLDPAVIERARVVFVCVETPLDPSTKDPDLKALRSAVSTVGRHLKRGTLVVIESTLPPTTMDRVVRPLLERLSGLKVSRGFYLAHAPERVTPGKLLHNLHTMPRLIGAPDEKTAAMVKRLYARFVKGELLDSSWVHAEIAKTAENAYYDVQIAFANELALICEEYDADVYEVRRLVNSCPGRSVLHPGTGVGGACIPKDPWLLIANMGEIKVHLVPTARDVNEFMPVRTAQLALEALRAAGRRPKGARVAVLGFAYRGNTGDTRATPAIPFIRTLRKHGADVAIHDPYAQGERGYAVDRDLETVVKDADCVAVLADHDAYRGLDFAALGKLMRTKTVVDGRNLVPESVRAHGFVLRALGKGQL
jgi:UDP-N-acetyl-D-mannosaminuronic acid dehydrogenase